MSRPVSGDAGSPRSAGDGGPLRLSGPADALPLLFLHGWGSRARDHERLLRRLARTRKVLAPDLAGHGRSRPPGPFSPRRQAAGLLAGIEASGGEPLALAGISLGGMIALELALLAPERVRALVVLHAPASTRLHRPGRLRGALERELWPRFFGLQGTAERLAARYFPGPEQGAWREGFVRAFTGNDPRLLRRASRALWFWSVEARLPEVSMPTLLVGAGRDRIARSELERMASRMPRARVAWLEELGHASAVEDPVRVAAVLGDFLDGL